MEPLRYIQIYGVGLYAWNGALKAYPADRITPELRSFIREHRDDLIAALEVPDIETTLGNILTLHPHEVEELRAEIAATPFDDPNLDHDRAALAKADPILAKRGPHRLEGVAA